MIGKNYKEGVARACWEQENQRNVQMNDSSLGSTDAQIEYVRGYDIDFGAAASCAAIL